MRHEQQGPTQEEHVAAVLRHPSSFGKEPDHVRREAVRRHATQQVIGVALQMHDFFRYGNPHSVQELDCFLHEDGANTNAEALLDGLVEALTQLGIDPTPWAAA